MSADRRRRRMRFERAGRHFMNRQLAAAWNTWWVESVGMGVNTQPLCPLKEACLIPWWAGKCGHGCECRYAVRVGATYIFIAFICFITYHDIPSVCRFAHHTECKRQGNLLSKAAGRMKNLKLARSYYKWYDLILEKRVHELKAGK